MHSITSLITWNIIISYVLLLISPKTGALASELHQNLPNHLPHTKLATKFLPEGRSKVFNMVIIFRQLERSDTDFFLTYLKIFCIPHFLFSESGQLNPSLKDSSPRKFAAELSFMGLVNVFGKLARGRKGKNEMIIKVINLISPQIKRKL